MELSFTLINESNIRVLVRELLSFLEVADNEFKPTMTSQIGIAADRYAPNKRWHIDTMLRVLKLAGNYVKEPILASFVRLIAQTTELQTYTAQKLYAALKEDITQEGLTIAGTWVIGEYGDSLLRGGQYEEEELVTEVKESDIVDLFATILGSAYSGQIVTQYIVTSMIKLTTRFTDAEQVEKIRRLMQRFQTNLDVDVQQRAVEYSNLFAYDQVRRGVLEKMPAPEIREAQRVLGEATTKKPAKTLAKTRKPVQIKEEDMLLDLMGGSDNMPTSPAVNGGQNNASLLEDILGGGDSAPAASSAPARNNVDSIMDLFGTNGSSTSAAAAPAPAAQQSASADLLGGFGGGSQAPTPAAPTPQAYPVFDKSGLRIAFQIRRDANTVQVLARFGNTGSAPLASVSLLAAVPKSQKLQLQPISQAELGPGQEATQQMRVQSVSGVSERPRVERRSNC